MCFKCCGLQIPVPSDQHVHIPLMKSCESNAWSIALGTHFNQICASAALAWSSDQYFALKILIMSGGALLML